MASSWGDSWGSAWGDAWGKRTTVVVLEPDIGGGAEIKRPYIPETYIDEEAELMELAMILVLTKTL